jgi:signal transduction histidine kinase
MLRKLRTRLTLSHTLPVLVMTGLLGLALLYLLETRYFLNSLVTELADQGKLIAQFEGSDAALWHDPALAENLVDQLRQRVSGRIMFIDPQGRLLASTSPQDQGLVGKTVETATIQKAMQGQLNWLVNYSARLREEVVDVAVPVLDEQGHVVGIVRLSRSLAQVQDRLVPLRWLVLVTLLFGTIIALTLSLLLARSLEMPLVRLTQAAVQLTPSSPPQPVPESGPDEIKTLAITFNQMAHRLYEADLSWKRLLVTIVHELGRPLGSIKVAAQAISSGAAPDQATMTELAAGIDQQVDQLRQAVDDLTLLGQTQVQELTLDRHPLDLIQIVGELCHQYTVPAHQKQITLTCQVIHEPPVVEADPARLRQIIDNLLDNACKYTPKGGQVSVRLDTEDNGAGSPPYVIVQVIDNGPGIASPEEQEDIFRLFYRNPQQQRLHRGMGIGLYLSRRLAEAHGGSLVVESQPGKGSTFTLKLLADAQSPGA